MTALFRDRQRPLTLGPKLGEGGEAAVYAVARSPRLVAKLYHRPMPLHAAKLEAMLAAPPKDSACLAGHTSITWPVESIRDAQGTVVGFLMPRIDLTTSTPLLRLYNPRDRARTAPGFTWEYLLRTARNLAGVLEALHARGYVAGDLNESNLLVSDSALVTLVDCDSMQVPASGGRIFRCPVGKAEYTPPELQGLDFCRVDRTPEHDAFGLGVLIFMLLMEGVHPFAGVWSGPGEPPSLQENIRAGRCPYLGSPRLAPPHHALALNVLPPSLRELLQRCLGGGNPSLRPAAAEWRPALEEAERRLSRCRANGRHVYSRHLPRCPWCERLAKGLPDPFPPPLSQKPLPASPFAREPRRSGRPAFAATRSIRPSTTARGRSRTPRSGVMRPRRSSRSQTARGSLRAALAPTRNRERAWPLLCWTARLLLRATLLMLGLLLVLLSALLRGVLVDSRRTRRPRRA